MPMKICLHCGYSATTDKQPDTCPDCGKIYPYSKPDYTQPGDEPKRSLSRFYFYGPTKHWKYTITTFWFSLGMLLLYGLIWVVTWPFRIFWSEQDPLSEILRGSMYLTLAIFPVFVTGKSIYLGILFLNQFLRHYFSQRTSNVHWRSKHIAWEKAVANHERLVELSKNCLEQQERSLLSDLHKLHNSIRTDRADTILTGNINEIKYNYINIYLRRYTDQLTAISGQLETAFENEYVTIIDNCQLFERRCEKLLEELNSSRPFADKSVVAGTMHLHLWYREDPDLETFRLQQYIDTVSLLIQSYARLRKQFQARIDDSRLSNVSPLRQHEKHEKAKEEQAKLRQKNEDDVFEIHKRIAEINAIHEVTDIFTQSEAQRIKVEEATVAELKQTY